MGYGGGFGATSNVVCTIYAEVTGEKMGCMVTNNGLISSLYYNYVVQSIDILNLNTVYYVTLTTQNGLAN